MSMFDIGGDYVFPIISGTPSAGNTMKVGRFLGTGFYINSAGGFTTCKHVAEAITEGQHLYVGQMKGPTAGDYHRIQNVICHEIYDIAIGTVVTGRKTEFLKPYAGAFALGVDVGAFGYTDAGKENNILGVDPRYLKGHISRLAEEPFGFPTKSLCEMSFAVPSGFSGTAVLSEDYQLVGMAYGNAESKILSYSVTEVVDGNSTFLENVYRVMEFGLCHTVTDLKAVFSELGVRSFE
ncbi:serine protease [Geomonas subterranea]|uniref:Serine protease n=2 Tax=Geomonas subterranea TaxID=2847989 RepID=A0ABX8LEV1_9BACT|nr:serine protease [Geomonas subterranea]QXE89170.1 serine protease [Geomonas subterranea]